MISWILPALGYILATFLYSPEVFTILGQIDDLVINTAILYESNASVTLGPGPIVSLMGGLVSVIAGVMNIQLMKKKV